MSHVSKSKKRIQEAEEVLKKLGLPKQQQNERSALTLLALAGLGRTDSWDVAKRPMLRTLEIMQWMSEQYDKEYAPNSRETIRRQTLHQFEQASIIIRNPDDPSRPTNSGKTCYQLCENICSILRCFNKANFEEKCREFIDESGALGELYEQRRNMQKVPVTLPDGKLLELSAGAHNDLQKAIIEEFGSRFIPNGTVLYVGDTADKLLYLSQESLSKLGVPELNHDKLPDVVIYDSRRNWIFLIEAVTSHGPISPKRHAELEQMFANCLAGRVYVTAFLDMAAFKKYTAEISWESEVWIASKPGHMIHFNGVRFLGPYDTEE